MSVLPELGRCREAAAETGAGGREEEESVETSDLASLELGMRLS